MKLQRLYNLPVLISFGFVLLLGSCGGDAMRFESGDDDDLIIELSLTGEESCDKLYDYLDEAALNMQSCTTDSDCQELEIGTYGSCGCSNNLVVNSAADTSEYEAIVDALNENDDCGLSGTCDCIETDGVICQDNLCQWNYVGYICDV